MSRKTAKATRSRKSQGDNTLHADQSTASQLWALMEPRLRRVMELGQHLPDPTRVSELHALRIQTKGLRYAVQAWAECLAGSTVKLSKQLSRLQDLLGEIHDRDVQADALVLLLSEHHDQQRSALLAAAQPSGAPLELARVARDLARETTDVPVAGLKLALAHLCESRAARHDALVDLWAQLGPDLPSALERATSPR